MATINGTSGNDTLLGSTGDDVINLDDAVFPGAAGEFEVIALDDGNVAMD